MKTSDLPPPMIDERVWELARKKIKKDRDINVLIGLAALDPSEAIELLSMRKQDALRQFGGIPRMTCLQAILVRQDSHPDDALLDLRFRRMMAEIVSASEMQRREWIGYESLDSALWKACPMWFCWSLLSKAIEMAVGSREKEARLYPASSVSKETNETMKMLEDGMRTLRKPSFAPKQTSYKTPFPWLARSYETFDYMFMEAAELLWSAFDARAYEITAVLRQSVIRERTEYRWVPSDSRLFTGMLPQVSSTWYGLALLRRMIAYPTLQNRLGRIGDIETMLTTEADPEDNLQWLADGIIRAEVMGTEGLLIADKL